ncbi:MAG: signal peptidase II [Patescibacteria group bacterium]|nr:signal peptidase II [Patescibacteria group bacterium]
MKGKYILAVIVAGVALFLDQITKYYFEHNHGSRFIFWEPLLFLQFKANPNIAFGLPLQSFLFIAFAIIVLGLMSYLLFKSYQNKEFFQFFLILFIIAGAVGNIIDRIQYGYVVDFITVPFWSIFNLADIYIVVAVVIWMFYIFIYEPRKKISKKS